MSGVKSDNFPWNETKKERGSWSFQQHRDLKKLSLPVSNQRREKQAPSASVI